MDRENIVSVLSSEVFAFCFFEWKYWFRRMGGKLNLKA
jgi:hypothetical protein